jgi:membrane protease YdiL (CAAX protease family)
MRPPQVPSPWPVLNCISTLALLFAISGFIQLYAPSTALDDLGFWKRVLDYRTTTLGWVALTMLTTIVIPLVEELTFRGRIQHAWERRYSPTRAVAITAVLFMSLHSDVPRWSSLAISLTLGIANGATVYLAGSIWPAVISHSLWNASMDVLSAIHDDPTSTFGGMTPPALLPLACALAGIGLAGWYPLLSMGRTRRRTLTIPATAPLIGSAS